METVNESPSNTLSNLSIGVSLFMLAMSFLFIYITFRILQTLLHLRDIRNSLQKVDATALRSVIKDESLINSINQCCDGGFLWLPLLGAGFNFIGAIGMGFMAVGATINSFSNNK